MNAQEIIKKLIKAKAEYDANDHSRPEVFRKYWNALADCAQDAEEMETERANRCF